MRRSYHCLHHVLPPLRMVDNLRARGDPYILPECSTNVHKKSFVVRSLYGFIKDSLVYITRSTTIYVLFCSTVVFLFICIASHCYVMSLLCLCAFVTLNKRLLTYLLTYFTNFITNAHRHMNINEYRTIGLGVQ